MVKKTYAAIMAVGVGTFMSSLDSGAVNLALPLIREGFGTSISMVEWITTSYLLIISSLLLSFGRLADLYGHKRVYATGFIFFVTGSLLCGVSTGIEMLIGGRVVQALGAGMLMATGPAIITNAVPPDRRGKALSVVAIAVALGLSAGPAIGGILATLWGWQSIFFINLPVGIVGMVLVRRNVPKDENRKAVPFDVAGGLLIFFALLLLLLPLSLSGDHHIPPIAFAATLSSSLVLVACFIFLESRREYPMLNLMLFKNRIFTASNVAAVCTYMAQFIMVFLTPFYLQNLRGYSAMASGLIYLAMPIATLCIAPVSGAISDRFDGKYISAAGAFVLAAGLYLLSKLTIDTRIAYIDISLVIIGLGFGMFQTPNNSAIMGNVPQEYRGTASGTMATMRNIGMALGIAVSGALFTFSQKRLTILLSGRGMHGTMLQATAFAGALHATFLAASAVAILAMAASLVKGRSS
ncbi:MFS transporter [Sediminispirochaeta bajacaliforniensis]|uniref:MFS transporter n=1 Tax=Sediminispirochaeta bajacaliforniensis TaxID=148 RepID=UPI000382DC11|nr:MFS transporter [Sediminispirochaeta bajacaliforniensis]